MEDNKYTQKYPSKEQVEKTRKLCEDYRGAAERMKINKARLSQIVSRQNKSQSEFEKNLYEKDINELRQQIKTDDENTSFFHWALGELGEREKTVIEQLYVDGYTWSSILSETGEYMSVGAIDKARKRGLENMTSLILKKKAEIYAQSEMSKENS